MRALALVGLVSMVGLGCGGGASKRDACENVCGCLATSSPTAQQECVTECVNGSSQDFTSQACIDCAANATCTELIEQDKCAVQCDDGS